MLYRIMKLPIVVLAVGLQSLATSTRVTETPLQLPPPFVHAGDAIYDIQTTKLRSALLCPHGTPGGTSPPALMVHRPGSSSEESWNKAYFAILSGKGYAVCYLDLPQKGTGDMQKSAAYIAYNLHHLSWISAGQKVLIIAHGQANSIVQWALQFYPSTQRVTSSFIGLSPNFSGIEPSAAIDDCEFFTEVNETRCLPYIWQGANNSEYYKALHYKYGVAQVPTTLLWTKTDDVVTPPDQNAYLPSAISTAIQSLCPSRHVNNTAMLTDAVVLKMVLDVLLHGGRGAVSRLLTDAYTWCAMEDAAEVVPLERSRWEKWLGRGQKRLQVENAPLLGGGEDSLASKVASEPELMAYALPRNQ